jgi:G:T-mismatch repair DNA endonuclease (very short patch repair protein)
MALQAKYITDVITFGGSSCCMKLVNSRSSKVHRSLRSVIKITQIRFYVTEKVDGLLMKWIPFVRRPTTKVIIAAGICYSRNGHVSMNSPLIFCKATELDRRCTEV